MHQNSEGSAKYVPVAVIVWFSQWIFLLRRQTSAQWAITLLILKYGAAQNFVKRGGARCRYTGGG